MNSSIDIPAAPAESKDQSGSILNPWTRFKNWMKDRMLHKQLQQNKVNTSVAFSEAQSILILYDATNEELVRAVRAYAETLSDRIPEIFLLGYKDARLSKGESRSRGIIYRNDLSLFDQPKQKIISFYNSRSYDIIITVSPQFYYPLIYMASACKASLRAGNYGASHLEALDIQVSANPDYTPEEFLNELDSILQTTVKNH